MLARWSRALSCVKRVNLNKMFWSKPRSLALAADSPYRIHDPQYEGAKRFMLKLMLFYSKQSQFIRSANAIYSRVLYQVDRPAIYDVFSLEETFKTTYSLLILHMWLCLCRLRKEGNEGVELGQYLYEIYNHENVFLDDDTSKPSGDVLLSVQFLVKKCHVATPHADYCLPGITRGTEKMVLSERRICISEFHRADEVITTGTMGELTPISLLYPKAEKEWKLAQSNMESSSSGLVSAANELSITSINSKSALGEMSFHLR
ncbi:ubiquinol-cytochrome C chaperone family protein [Perilla frutescens var. frutescens]|nr:ubiquinol-cytochrome C chaperone family protein [Perilla frutescens var. frutescens]